MAGPVTLKPGKVAQYTTEAGTMLKGEAGISITPLQLEIDLGLGGLFMDNIDTGQFFFSPSISGLHEAGDFSFSWLYSAGIVLEGETKRPVEKAESKMIINDGLTAWRKKIKFEDEFYHTAYMALSYGTHLSENFSFKVLAGSGGLFRHGKEARGELRGGYFQSDVGLSLNIGNVSLYDIASFTWGPQKAHKQHWTEKRPFFQQNVVGVHGPLPEGNGIYAEWTHDVFFDEVVLGGEISALWGTKVAISGRRESEIFGEAYTLGFLIEIPIKVESTTYLEMSSETELTTRKYRPFMKYKAANMMANSYKVALLAPRHILGNEEDKKTKEEFSEDVKVVYGTEEELDNRLRYLDSVFPELPNVRFEILRSMGNSTTLDEFVDAFKEKSVKEKILAAISISGLAGLFYSYEMMNASSFSSEWERWGDTGPNEIYKKMREGLGKGEKLDIGICAHLNGLAAEFLRRNGLEAYGIGGVPTADQSHYIAFAREKNKSYLLDYWTLYEAEGGLLDVLRIYGNRNGLHIDSVYLFGEEGKYFGLYITPEGRLIRRVASPLGKTREEHVKHLLMSKPKKMK